MNLNPTETAVVVLHLQNDIIVNEQALGAMMGGEAARRNVVGEASKLLQAADAASVLPILVRVASRPDRSNMLLNLPLTQGTLDMKALIDGEPGAEFVDGLTRVASEVVVTHQNPNPFVGSDLHDVLQRRGTKTLVMCGVATNMAVLSTAFAAASLGYRMIVVPEACSAVNEETHQFALQTLGMLAEIVAIDDVVTALSAPAAA